jgi:hypothetical protein
MKVRVFHIDCDSALKSPDSIPGPFGEMSWEVSRRVEPPAKNIQTHAAKKENTNILQIPITISKAYAITYFRTSVGYV